MPVLSSRKLLYAFERIVLFYIYFQNMPRNLKNNPTINKFQSKHFCLQQSLCKECTPVALRELERNSGGES